MTKKFIPSYQIGSAGFLFGRKEKEYVAKVLKSHRLSYGPWSQKFEEIFAKEHDSKFAVFSNSGTSALQMALAAMKEKYNWQDGDEVIVPASTFIATSNIVLFNNMKPVFVDVDPRTYNIDPSKIEEAITKKTRAIIPVHLYGLPADMDPIMKISKVYKLRVLEDSCECMFAKYKGRKVGSFGDVGCFSTYIAHFLVTGVGGLATTSDPELATLMRSYMNHGRDSIYLNIDADKGLSSKKLKMVVSKRFSFVRLGHSMRATELEAAIGVAQFEGRHENIKKRKAIAEFYTKHLLDLSNHLQLPIVPKDRDHHFMMYPIVLKNMSKKNLVNYLEEHNIETREMVPLTNQPIYKKIFGNDLESHFPVAEWINKNGFYIGSHPYLKTIEIKYIVDTIHNFFKK
ncbi:MAG: DegT/DnrJ/EryC1/StrS family aminotransferase [bacterium]|nr:DegT/DnrJ/EryC1/StrS family aminotransferase [bacterium]